MDPHRRRAAQAISPICRRVRPRPPTCSAAPVPDGPPPRPASSGDQSDRSPSPASAAALQRGAPPPSPPTTTPPPPVTPPSGDLSGPTSTSPAGVISLPNQRAEGASGGAV